MRRNPPARWTLPTVIDPPAKKCIMLEVPDDPAHIAAFRGALLALASGYNWADDPAHKAREVAQVWRDIIDSHQEWGCAMPIEFMQDDCGLYYREIGAAEWVQIYDGQLCLESSGARSFLDGVIGDYIDGLIQNGTLQNGTGAYEPLSASAPGSCQTLHVVLRANESWALPIRISTDDTISISNARGGWNDGAVYWYCPSGDSYGIGSCTPDTSHTEETDPINTAPHMTVIGNKGGTYFECFAATFAAPEGWSNELVTLQANDASLSDNGGEISFDLQVCTGGAYDWVHDWDMSVDYGKFLLDRGEWSVELGFKTAYVTGSHTLLIHRDSTGGGTLSYVRMEGNFEKGASNPYNAFDVYGTSPARSYVEVPFSEMTDGGYSIVRRPNLVLGGNLYVQLLDCYGCSGGQSNLKRLVIAGTGQDPYVD